jgi:hypothetical protein
MKGAWRIRGYDARTWQRPAPRPSVTAVTEPAGSEAWIVVAYLAVVVAGGLTGLGLLLAGG